MIPKEVLDNLATTYAYYYTDRDDRPTSKEATDAANAVLGIIDITYNSFSNSLICDGLASSCSRGKTKWGPKWTVKITPYKNISSFDVECMEGTVNSPKYIGVANQLAPLFDCIGWQLLLTKEENPQYYLEFVGSPTWDGFLVNTDWKTSR